MAPASQAPLIGLSPTSTPSNHFFCNGSNRDQLFMKHCAFLVKSTGLVCILVAGLSAHAQSGQANAVGTPPYPAELTAKLAAALAAKGHDYKPRTVHLREDGTPKFTNRLILEDSPYLLQHAHNPVNWYPWGKEAFAAARRENKPVFLSIGYSTCHWCHVMERESFDKLDVARYMNEHFIAIKVDRERRPDVDATYMIAVMLLTQHGGWPMSSFLTADGKTFFGGTYFPPDRFMKLLHRAAQLWHEKQPELIEQANSIAAEVQRISTANRQAATVDAAVIKQAIDRILQRSDDLDGGFGPAPKFPNETYLMLLLEAAKRHNDQAALAAAEQALQAMAQGGIYDQIGGGFHRYSTDNHWLVPHFEKMLYNQANLVRAYLTAYEITGKGLYARVSRQTLDYVLREMTAANGGFYSATDADSAGQEGAFFVWTPTQIRQALAKEDAALAIRLFGVTPSGNFEGKNILYLPRPIEQVARQQSLGLPDLQEKIERLRTRLRRSREQRPHPGLDNKIVTAWNGMMITALAMAGGILGEPPYLHAAVKAAGFLWNSNRDRKTGQLWRSNLDDRPSVPAAQQDYAYLSEAFITLFDISGQDYWLERAQTITEMMIDQFWDRQAGGFFMNVSSTGTPMMARPKGDRDSAIPSGNAVALRVLAKLARRTGKNSYLQRARQTLAAHSASIRSYPDAYSYMLLGAQELLQNESGQRQYAARGNVLAAATVERGKDRRGWLNVTLTIKRGWHVNANRPLDKKLIATTVGLDEANSAWTMEDIEYPPALIKQLGFSQDRMALYESSVPIRAQLQKTGAENAGGLSILPVKLKLQACNDKFCLPPEALTLHVPTFQLSKASMGESDS
ncbi:MAG: thioredoxin domain-containing protein [Gammaproteobacteria bacterium]